MRTRSPAAIAEALGISPDKVRAFIEEGLMPATDVRSPGSSRPRFRISDDQLQEFLNRRRVLAAPEQVKRKRRKKQSHSKQYF